MSEAERNYRAAASYVPGFVDIWDTVGTGKNEATGLLREAVSELRQINQGQRSPARRAAAYAG